MFAHIVSNLLKVAEAIIVAAFAVARYSHHL